MKHIGTIIVILGALALIIPALAGFETNTTLVIGGILLVGGAIAHAFTLRKGMDNDK